jgi:hypothetical protein
MNTEERIVRIRIEGSWTAGEMAESLTCFRDLYNIRLVLQVIYEDYHQSDDFYELYRLRRNSPRLARRLTPAILSALRNDYYHDTSVLLHATRFVFAEEELKVRRIEYASPGYKDLAGFGEIVGHVKDFTLRIIEHFNSRRRRELLDEEQELKNQALRIRNAREYVGLARECGYDETELRRIIRYVDDKQEPLIRLVSEGKIQNVLMLDEGDVAPDPNGPS